MLFRRLVSDKTLIERVLRGQRDEFALLVDRYLPMVHALAFAQLGNATDADDVAQETFLKAYTSLDTLHNRAAFRPWLAAIARNAALSIVRARKPTAPLDPNMATDENPQREAERRDLHEVLKREILRLDPEFREVLVLHYFSGLKIREVADTIGASPDATAKRIQRAREALGKSLVRELEVFGETPPTDWKKAKTRIMAALIGVPVAWEAGAMAGVGGVGLAAKLAAGGVVALLIAAAALLLPNPSRSNPASPPNPDVAVAQANEPKAAPGIKADSPNDPGSKAPSSAIPGYPVIPSDGPGVIRGRVVYPDGTPAPGATVVLVLRTSEFPSGTPWARREVRADSEGNFRFDGVPVADPMLEYRWYGVLAYVDGEAAGTGTTVLMKQHPGHFFWLELVPAGRITGRVVDAAGAPVVGAVLTPWKWDGGETGHSPINLQPVTDKSGGFSCPYLWPGAWQFVVSAPGYARLITRPLALGVVDALIALRPSCMVVGTAIDSADGGPIPNLPVRLGGSDVLSETYETATEKDGTFTLDTLPPGEYTVQSGGAYYIDRDEVRVALRDSAGRTELNLSPHLGAVIEGKVVRKGSGDPAVGALITCRNGVGFGRELRTETDGGYRIEGLPPGRYELMLDLVDNLRKSLSVEAGREYHANFELQEGDAMLAGIVVDPEENPVPGARVELERQARLAISGADGKFVFTGTVSSRYSDLLAAYVPGLAGTSECLEVAGVRTDLRMMVGEPAWVTGRVVDDRGKAVSGATVDYHLLSGSLCQWRPARTTDNGRFALGGVPPGEYALSVERQGMPRMVLTKVKVAPGETLENVVLTLPGSQAEGTLTGKVLDSAGRPVAGGFVRAQGPRQAQTSVRTNKNGKYTITGLIEGIYRVNVSGQGYNSVEQEAIIPSMAQLDFVLQKAAAISGRVFDAATRSPLAKFNVAFVPGEHTEETGPYESRAVPMTSEAGEFTLNNLAPGSGTLAAWADDYEPAWIVLDLPEGGHAEGQDLHLTPKAAVPSAPDVPEPTVSFEGIVLDEQRRPVAGANIYVQDVPHPSERGTGRAAVTDAQGRFAIASVPVTTARIFATHADYAPAGAALVLREGAMGRVELVLPPSGTVTGIVVMDGKPVSNAWVNVDFDILDERIYENGDTDGQGRFTIENIPPGDAAAHLNLDIGSNLYRGYKQPITMPSGGTVEVEFSLVGGLAVVEGKVSLNGEPDWSTITVTIPLADGTSDISAVTTRNDGTFIIPMLPETPITLRVRDEERREKEIQVTPVAGESTYVEFEMAE